MTAPTTIVCVPLSVATAVGALYRQTMTAELLRSQIAATVRQLVVGEHGKEPDSSWDPDDPTPIPLDSPVRTVIGDPAMFVGGVRALLFQTLHPVAMFAVCLLYTSPSPRDATLSRMPSSA